MEQVRKRLLWIVWVAVGIGALTAGLFEGGLLPEGTLACDKITEFYFLTIMEIVSICVIPVALRLFKWAFVRRQLVRAPQGSGLLLWGTLRLLMLCLPMVCNVVLYYLFMHPAFGYMGIILLLTLFFIYPSSSRCHNETDGSHS